MPVGFSRYVGVAWFNGESNDISVIHADRRRFAPREASGTVTAAHGFEEEPRVSIDEVGAAEPEMGERDAMMLDFERQWWKFAGSKEEAIREKFDLSSTRYYQLLNSLIDRPEALAADPLLVKRLRRMRDSRKKARAARSKGMRFD